MSPLLSLLLCFNRAPLPYIKQASILIAMVIIVNIRMNEVNTGKCAGGGGGGSTTASEIVLRLSRGAHFCFLSVMSIESNLK